MTEEVLTDVGMIVSSIQSCGKEPSAEHVQSSKLMKHFLHMKGYNYRNVQNNVNSWSKVTQIKAATPKTVICQASLGSTALVL